MLPLFKSLDHCKHLKVVDIVIKLGSALRELEQEHLADERPDTTKEREG